MRSHEPAFQRMHSLLAHASYDLSSTSRRPRRTQRRPFQLGRGPWHRGPTPPLHPDSLQTARPSGPPGVLPGHTIRSAGPSASISPASTPHDELHKRASALTILPCRGPRICFHLLAHASYDLSSTSRRSRRTRRRRIQLGPRPMAQGPHPSPTPQQPANGRAVEPSRRVARPHSSCISRQQL